MGHVDADRRADELREDRTAALSVRGAIAARAREDDRDGNRAGEGFDKRGADRPGRIRRREQIRAATRAASDDATFSIHSECAGLRPAGIDPHDERSGHQGWWIAPPETERLQSPEDRARYDDGTKCILCAACTTSCPPFWANKEFVGPAAIVNAHRFIFDSRDQGADERLGVLNTRNGVWRCRTVFNCTDACPRDIEITRAIEDVKRTLLFGRL